MIIEFRSIFSLKKGNFLIIFSDYLHEAHHQNMTDSFQKSRIYRNHFWLRLKNTEIRMNTPDPSFIFIYKKRIQFLLIQCTF